MNRRAQVTRAEHARRSTRQNRSRRIRPLWAVPGLVLAASGLTAGTAGAAPQPVGSRIETAVVTYNDDGAPNSQAAIAQATGNWNSSVNNVRFVDTDGTADLYFYECGGDTTMDDYSTDGHGHGYICIPYSPSGYDPVRVIAHGLGHILGLPDHYSGPCSELMSGGGAGPSCTNATPNANESARVDYLWANG